MPSQLLRMDNIGIVVESLDDAVAFFTELGLTCEGRGRIEGEWAGRVTGLGDQSVEVAMMVTPDGHSRLELSRFLAPAVVAGVLVAVVVALVVWAVLPGNSSSGPASTTTSAPPSVASAGRGGALVSSPTGLERCVITDCC